MSGRYKTAIKEICNKYRLLPFNVQGEIFVYRSVEEVIIGDDPITVFYYRDQDTWTHDSIESQILEALLTHGF